MARNGGFDISMTTVLISLIIIFIIISYLPAIPVILDHFQDPSAERIADFVEIVMIPWWVEIANLSALIFIGIVVLLVYLRREELLDA